MSDQPQSPQTARIQLNSALAKFEETGAAYSWDQAMRHLMAYKEVVDKWHRTLQEAKK